MEQILATLLLILPGFACRCLAQFFKENANMDDTMSRIAAEGQLQFTVSSLFYGVWVVMLSYLVMSRFYPLRTVDQIKNGFNDTRFIFLYIIFTTLSCFIVAAYGCAIRRSIIIPIMKRRGAPAPLGYCVMLSRRGKKKAAGILQNNPFAQGKNDAWVIKPYPILEYLQPEEIEAMTVRYYYDPKTDFEVKILNQAMLKKWVPQNLDAPENLHQKD